MAQINYTTLNQLNEGTKITGNDLLYMKGAGEDGEDFKTKANTLKGFVRPENASSDSGGLLTTLEQEIAGLKKFVSGLEAQFAAIKNDLAVLGSATIHGNLDIAGDLRVKGKTKKIESSTLEVANNEIITRAESTSALGAGEFTGIRAKKYDGQNDGRLVFGKDGVARVGDEGQEQALATREDAPFDKSLAFWDATENRYKSILPGTAGDLLESGGEGNLPQFTTFPKINVKSITQTVTSLEDGGENEITCELSNGVKSTFTIRNGSKGDLGGVDPAIIDTVPTASSSKLITSGGVKTALDKKMNNRGVDTTPTTGSYNLITSGAVKTALEATSWYVIQPAMTSSSIIDDPSKFFQDTNRVKKFNVRVAKTKDALDFIFVYDTNDSNGSPPIVITSSHSILTFKIPNNWNIPTGTYYGGGFTYCYDSFCNPVSLRVYVTSQIITLTISKDSPYSYPNYTYGEDLVITCSALLL